VRVGSWCKGREISFPHIPSVSVVVVAVVVVVAAAVAVVVVVVVVTYLLSQTELSTAEVISNCMDLMLSAVETV